MKVSVDTRHPDFTADREYEFRLMRDTMAGARAVKARGEFYLPMPSGFRQMSDGGVKAYSDSYKFRAIVPEILAPSIGAMIGIIHAKETQIAIPDAMAGVWENADGDGMPLEAFHRKITRNLLWLGRYGVLASAPASGGEPYLVGYSGDAIINWDRDFFVLDETGYIRSGFEWEHVPRYRVLNLEDGRFVSSLFTGREQSEVSVSAPESTGERPLDFVPFVVGNARDVSASLETPPLIGVGNAIVNAYQLSADWRWQLFMSGQETLLVVNGEAPKFVGAGAIHTIQTGDQRSADMKYVSPNCTGIEKHEDAIQAQIDAAVMAGARMFERQESTQESGEARRLRFASETANLMSVAQVSAALLERGLRFIARMKGLPDNTVSDIVVTPPKDLLDNTMSAQDFASLFQVYQSNGMSWETYYERGQQGGIFSAERDADEEYDLITQEGEDGDAGSSFNNRGDAAKPRVLGDA